MMGDHSGKFGCRRHCSGGNIMGSFFSCNLATPIMGSCDFIDRRPSR